MRISEIAASTAKRSGRKTVLQKDILSATKVYSRHFAFLDNVTFKPGKIPVFKRTSDKANKKKGAPAGGVIKPNGSANGVPASAKKKAATK